MTPLLKTKNVKMNYVNAQLSV